MNFGEHILIVIWLTVIVQVSSKTLVEYKIIEEIFEKKNTELKKNVLRLEEENLNLTTRIKEYIQRQNYNASRGIQSLNETTVKPKNCEEATKGNIGIFMIELPNSNMTAFPVFCESHNWMVILRSVDGSVDFQRDWAQYRDGFGKLTSNFIMGLEKLHQITKSQCHELKIVLEDFENNMTYAIYDQFAIDDESNGYALKTLGNHSGTASDALNYHKGMKFTTIDRDNDLWKDRNCAKNYNVGWWYKTCFKSKLTGHYFTGAASNYDSIIWYDETRGYYSYKFAEMKIRPKQC